MVRRVEIDYTPRKAFLPYHDRTERWACIVAHRRAGKTLCCINDDIRDCLRSVHWRTGEVLSGYRAAYIAPTYAQAKMVAWDYAKQFARDIPGVKFNESELRVDFPNGARYRLMGAENYDALRGIYLDKATLDEPADQDPRAWREVIRPALSDREGRATFIGTPKGHNEFYRIHQNAESSDKWFSMVLRASETKILPQEELDDARAAMSEDAYDQEFEASFEAAIVGAYYGREMKNMDDQGRIGHVPHDPHIPVFTSWDLGLDDATAIVFIQQVGREFHIIDYYENHDHPIAHYATILQQKAIEEGYVYDEHYLPHDVKARELQTGKSREEALYNLGIRVFVGQNSPIADGIETVRRMLPMTWIDGERCERLVEALKVYQREWDEKNKVFRQKPKHNWASHAADAVRTFAANHVEDQFRQMDMDEDRVYNIDRSGRNDMTGY